MEEVTVDFGPQRLMSWLVELLSLLWPSVPADESLLVATRDCRCNNRCWHVYSKGYLLSSIALEPFHRLLALSNSGVSIQVNG
jgi:hypothetical protein